MRTLVASVMVAVILVPLAGCGKRPFAEFVSKEGGFSVLLPGAPREDRSTQSGVKVTLYVAETWGAAYGAGYTDLPPGIPGNLEGAVRAMAEACNGRVIQQQGQNAGPDGWLEFEIESDSPKGYAAGRMLVVGGRVYEVYVMGRKARLADPETRSFIDSFRLTDRALPWQSGATPSRAESAPPPAATGPAVSIETAVTPVQPPVQPPAPSPVPSPPRPPAPPREQICGGAFDPEFRDAAPTGGFLVGLDVGLHTFINYDTVCTVRPIFGVGDQYTYGQLHGTDVRRAVRVLAKPGYAVGGLSVKSGLGVDGFFVTFMKVTGDRLDPSDSYNSEWLGGPGGGGPTKLGGDGTPVVGLIGKQNRADLTGIGLMFGTPAGR